METVLVREANLHLISPPKEPMDLLPSLDALVSVLVFGAFSEAWHEFHIVDTRLLLQLAKRRPLVRRVVRFDMALRQSPVTLWVLQEEHHPVIHQDQATRGLHDNPSPTVP